MYTSVRSSTLAPFLGSCDLFDDEMSTAGNVFSYRESHQQDEQANERR